MNKILFVFLILFFAAAIAIGLTAIFDDVRPNSRAGSSCPPQELPSDNQCSDGASVELVKNSSGCYEFVCL